MRSDIGDALITFESEVLSIDREAIANGVDAAAYPERSAESRQRPVRSVITVANLRPEKSHETLIAGPHVARMPFALALVCTLSGLLVTWFAARPQHEKLPFVLGLLGALHHRRDLVQLGLELLGQRLQPLVDVVIAGFRAFLPRQAYPIRSGVHANTAFGLSLALDYARAVGDRELEALIVERARTYYGHDVDAPAAFAAASVFAFSVFARSAASCDSLIFAASAEESRSMPSSSLRPR